MFKYLLTISILFFYFSSYSQLTEYFDEIRSEFSDNKQEELIQIEKNIIEAEKIEMQASIYLNSGDTSKSIGYFKKASDIFNSSYRPLYMLFDTKLTEKNEDLSGDRYKYIRKLLDEAKNSFRISIARRHLANKEKDKLLICEFYKSAHLKEKEAIKTHSHVYGIITGDIVEDMTIEKTDYSLENIFDNVITDNFETRSFTVFDPSVKENLTYVQVKEDNIENSDHINTNTKNSNSNSNSNNANKKYYRIQKEENGRVYYGYLLVETDKNEQNVTFKGKKYRIQIGTSILPANENQIERLNKTDLSVYTYKSDLYYKYTVGNFESFKEAKNYKHAFGLKNTYIVEYQDGNEKRLYLRDYQ